MKYKQVNDYGYCRFIGNCLTTKDSCSKENSLNCLDLIKRNARIHNCTLDGVNSCDRPQLCLLIPGNIPCSIKNTCIWDSIIPARLILGRYEEGKIPDEIMNILEVTARKYAKIMQSILFFAPSLFFIQSEEEKEEIIRFINRQKKDLLYTSEKALLIIEEQRRLKLAS